MPEELVSKLDKVLTEDNVDNFKYFIETCAYLSKGQRGFDLLVSDNGVDFNVITRDGFGDPYNHGLRVFAVTDSGLCIGTANPFYGTQVWKITNENKSEIKNSQLLEESGTYDINPEGSQHKLEVGINYNGNTIKDIQCDYASLRNGVDYKVNETGVVFTEEFLSTLEVKDYNLSFIFNVGSKSNYSLKVIDTTAAPDPDKPTDPDEPTDPDKPTNPDEPTNSDETNKEDKTEGEKPKEQDSQKKEGANTGDSAPTVLYSGIALISACGVIFAIKKKKEDYEI